MTQAVRRRTWARGHSHVGVDSGMSRRNLELKLRVQDLATLREACLRLAEPVGVFGQSDTYFHAPHGRLKLRETTRADGVRDATPTATLIAYRRPDSGDVRASDYHLVPVADPALLKSALSQALGVRGEVRKRREVLMHHNVRIHLDEVEGLGTFVELEAVISDHPDEALSRSRLDALCDGWVL